MQLTRISLLIAGIMAVLSVSRMATACCPAPPSGKAVVNADQTVIILWDAAWSNQCDAESRAKLLAFLKLPENTGPSPLWLTEFEDNWPYTKAPADLYFSLDPSQQTLKRPPIVQYVSTAGSSDITPIALAACCIGTGFFMRVRRFLRK